MKQELKSGIKEFDEAVEQFENGEINFIALTCRLWNKAYSIGKSEQLQQADVSGSNDPHEVSKVRCDLCGLKWIAVRPLGVEKLECKQCGNISNFENIGT